MRFICGVVGTVAAAGLATSAHALDLPPLPTVPTLTTPTLPVPVPAPPPLPAPVPPPPTTTVAPPAPAPAPSLPPAPVAPIAGPATPAPAPGAPSSTAGAPTAAGAAPAAPAQVYAPPPRTIAHRGNRPVLRRPVVAHFRLRHAARIRIRIQQLAPVCRALHGFTYRAHKGANAFRFPINRIARIGTYHLVALLHGKQLFSVHAQRLSRTRVRPGGTADVCAIPATTEAAFFSPPSSPLAASGSSSSSGGAQLHVKSAGTAGGIASTPKSSNPIVRAVTFQNAPSSVRPLLFVLLAMSIMLLGAAALPQSALPAGRTAALLTQRRPYIAAAGIWLLVVVAVVTVFS